MEGGTGGDWVAGGAGGVEAPAAAAASSRMARTSTNRARFLCLTPFLHQKKES